jgi:hypothetical protein
MQNRAAEITRYQFECRHRDHRDEENTDRVPYLAEKQDDQAATDSIDLDYRQSPKKGKTFSYK